jgi:hypothetical protein
MKNNLCLKRTYWKHLGHFLLQETEINLSSTDTRKFNVIYTMQHTAVAWESIMSTVLVLEVFAASVQ